MQNFVYSFLLRVLLSLVDSIMPVSGLWPADFVIYWFTGDHFIGKLSAMVSNLGQLSLPLH